MCAFFTLIPNHKTCYSLPLHWMIEDWGPSKHRKSHVLVFSKRTWVITAVKWMEPKTGCMRVPPNSRSSEQKNLFATGNPLARLNELRATIYGQRSNDNNLNWIGFQGRGTQKLSSRLLLRNERIDVTMQLGKRIAGILLLHTSRQSTTWFQR